MNDNEILARIEDIEKELQEIKKFLSDRSEVSSHIVLNRIETPSQYGGNITETGKYEYTKVRVPMKQEKLTDKLHIKGKILTKYTGNDSEFIIPEGITVIGRNAFYGCSNLQVVNLPYGIQQINEYAFYGCSNLQVVNLPYGIRQINEYAFYGCTSLKEINIPDSVNSIGRQAFYNCYSLTISYPQNCQYALDSFYNCEQIIRRR